MSQKSSGWGGCLGCLGSLVVFTFIGSTFFGGGILMRVGRWHLGFGEAVDRQQVVATYLTELESKQVLAAEAVEKFHTQLEQENYQEIYEQANELFKGSNTQSELISTLRGIHNQLGAVNSTQQVDWWGQPADQNLETYSILIRYRTDFSNASAYETFIWFVKDGNPELVSYDVVPVRGVGELEQQTEL